MMYKDTLIFLVADELEGNVGLLLIDVPSVEIPDVGVGIKSFGLSVFRSLLVLLSFKLRRRTGFWRIRLKEIEHE